MKTIKVLMLVVISSCAGLSEEKKEEGGLVKVEQAEKHLADGIQVLDVRTLEEWNEGYIKGAKRATVTEDGFVEKAKEAVDPTKPVLVYCRSGGRSAKAVAELQKAGFSQIYELKGGVLAWEEAKKPLVVPE